MSKWYTLQEKIPTAGSMYYVYIKCDEKELEKLNNTIGKKLYSPISQMVYFPGNISTNEPSGFIYFWHPETIFFHSDKVIAWFDHPDPPLESEIAK